MKAFLQETVEENTLELLLDTNIFSKDIILKAAYNFLDRAYFFFSLDSDKNMILQLTIRDESTEDPRNIIADFSDSLLETSLRDTLEKDNKIIRETIVEKAINGPLDTTNFVSLDTDNTDGNSEQNEIDFDKDIDDILKEIENDPDLKIDEAEIESILKEIEEETKNDIMKPQISVNPDAIKGAKDMFKNK